MIHGTLTAYRHGCRCEKCREANAAYQRAYRRPARTDRKSPALAPGRHPDLADLLHELAPMGLTDDCPARRVA
jgi:hypothetical protein